MTWSGMPFLAAMVAAPILKVWLEKFPGIHAPSNIWRNQEVSSDCVKDEPVCSKKNGPGVLPLSTKYATAASTAHKGDWPHLIWIKQPWRKGSILEALIRTHKHEGWRVESTATSHATSKWSAGEKLDGFGTVNSVDCRNPKYILECRLPRTCSGHKHSCPEPGKW